MIKIRYVAGKEINLLFKLSNGLRRFVRGQEYLVPQADAFRLLVGGDFELVEPLPKPSDKKTKMHVPGTLKPFKTEREEVLPAEDKSTE